VSQLLQGVEKSQRAAEPRGNISKGLGDVKRIQKKTMSPKRKRVKKSKQSLKMDKVSGPRGTPMKKKEKKRRCQRESQGRHQHATTKEVETRGNMGVGRETRRTWDEST